LTQAELRDAAVNEWERHQERLRSGPASTTTSCDDVATTSQAADNEQYHTDKTRPADLSIAELVAAMEKLVNASVAPVVTQPTIGISTDSDGIGGIDDG